MSLFRSILSVFAAVLGVLAFASVSALAAAPEKLEASSVAANTATLNGVLNPGAASAMEDYEFVYRQSPSECQGEGEKTTARMFAAGNADEAVKAAIAELLPGTQYTFCLQVKPEQQLGDEVLSAPVTFTTLASAAPTTGEASITDLTASGAILHAELSPQGQDTTYAFQYAPAGGAFVPVPEPEGSGGVPASSTGATLSVHLQRGLTPGAAYEFRLVASNVAGAVDGPPVSFTTQQIGGEFALADGRQWEMVTPPAKQGALFQGLGPFYNEQEGRNLVQASPAGNAIADVAASPSEAGAAGYANVVSVLSTRGSGGWSSRVLAPPHTQAAGPAEGYAGSEDLFFSEDLSTSLVQQFGFFTPLSPDASESTPYLRTDYADGNVSAFCTESCYQSLVTHADTRAGVEYGYCRAREACGPLLEGATPDLSHVILASTALLTSSPVHIEEPLANFREFLYEWSGGRLQPVSIYPSGERGGEGVLGEGELAGTVTFESSPIRHIGARRAISENGQRAIFLGIQRRQASGDESGIYLRDLAKEETVRLDVPEPGCEEKCTLSSNPVYLTADVDDSRIFFLDTGRLTVDSGAVSGSAEETWEPDLYECEVVEGVGGKLECRLRDLTPAGAGGEAANAKAVLGTSDDGSYVYFAAGGLLATGAARGECGNGASEGGGNTQGCDVYVRHDGVTKLVATGWTGGGYGVELAKASPDGRWFAFMSPASLTGYDNRDANSGQPDEEVYLYHAPEDLATESGTLTCASCDPTGARPVGVQPPAASFWAAANVPGWTYADEETDYQSRYLSDSGRLFFDSYDALVSKDVNGVEDVYEYEPEGTPAGEHACSVASTNGNEVFEPARAFEVGGVKGEEDAGCVALISSGTSSELSSFLDASGSGGDVFFTTTAKLAPQDVDDSPDVYDAHECTSGSPCIPPPAEQPPACDTEASCKASPAPQPSIYGLPSSATFFGPGNLTPAPSTTVAKAKTKPLTRAQRLAAALKQCRKDKRKGRRTVCEKSARKKDGVAKPKKSTHHKGSK